MRPYYAPTATFSPRYDQVLAEMNEQVIAYGRVDHGVDVEGVHLYYTTGHVHPRWRRQGLGHAILHHNEWRLRAIAATQPRDEPRVFAAWAVDTASDTEALLQNVGYRPVDHFYAMLRDSDATQLDAPLPPSFTIRPVRPTDYRTIWEPEQEAFRDHWGFVPGTEDDYQKWLHDPCFDPSPWQVAWIGSQLAGMVRNFIHAEENAAFGQARCGSTSGVATVS